MSDRLIDLLLRLAPRERMLLGVLVLVVLPTALWLGVLEPLTQTRTRTAQELTEAQAITQWVQGRVADKEALGEAEDSGPRAPIGISGVERGLIDARLREKVTELSNRTDGGIDLRFDTVNFTDLMRWMSRNEPTWGYDIAAFRFERTDTPANVFAVIRLMPQG